MTRFDSPNPSRSERYAVKLKQFFRSNPSMRITDRTVKAPIQALANFLAAYGPKVARLTKFSQGDLLTQEESKQQALREKAVTQFRKQAKSEIETAINRFNSGKSSLSQLEVSLKGTIKRLTLASAIVGVRGVGNITDNVLTAVQRELSRQFAYLDGLLADIEGNQITAKQKARALQYANSGWQTSQTASRQFNLDNSGLSPAELEERRRLGSAEHCDDCIALAGHWEPYGTLPPPGQGSVCGSNCECTMEQRPKQEETKTINAPTDDESVVVDGRQI